MTCSAAGSGAREIRGGAGEAGQEIHDYSCGGRSQIGEADRRGHEELPGIHRAASH